MLALSGISFYQAGDSIKLSQQNDSLTTIKTNIPKVNSIRKDSSKVKLSASKEISANPSATILKRNNSDIADSMKLNWNINDNFFIDNGLSHQLATQPTFKKSSVFVIHERPVKVKNFDIKLRTTQSNDWLLGIFLMIIILFIWIRLFYNKFFSMLGNALVSFQISAKLFQERNVLLRRVSYVLDFIYLIVFSIFVFELIAHFRLVEYRFSNLKLFLLIFNLIVLYTLSRILVLRLTGFIFDNSRVFAEYQHNTFVVNKGLGIALFPLIIAVQYLPAIVIPVLLLTGLVIYSGSVILKAFRAYQIIIRKDILFFYLILYLCTLEILPLLLGYKVMISLI